MFGSPEYRVGETVVAYLERSGRGRLRTKHMAMGKLDAEIREDGRVVLSGVGRAGIRKRQLLSSFRKSVRAGARSPGMARVASRLQTSAPVLEGIAQNKVAFRLMEPAARWFNLPVAVWGDLNGDSILGKAAGAQVVAAGAAAWSGRPGSEFEARYEGEAEGKGFTCNPGRIDVSFDDPLDQIADPENCSGALAVGGFCASSGTAGGTGYREITAGTIVFSDGWEQCSFWTQTNLEEIMAHELGHAIGLAHSWEAGLGSPEDSFVSDATMYWMAHFDGRGAGLTDYEGGAIAYLYDDGSLPLEPTPAPTPEPTPAPTSAPARPLEPAPAEEPPLAEPTPAEEPTLAEPADSDTDGVLDLTDNCPLGPNENQEDGDNDGLGDVCDPCPTQPDPNATCSQLRGDVRFVYDEDGRASASVRVHFFPWVGHVEKDIEVELSAAGQSFSVQIPASAISAEFDGRRGWFARDETSLMVRKYRTAETRLLLRAESDVLPILEREDLEIRVIVGNTTAIGQMPCRTRTTAQGAVTACEQR